MLHAVKSVSPVVDKRLQIDIAILQEALENKEVGDICYVPSDENLANALTKQGASSRTWIEVLSGCKKFQYSKKYFE